MTTNTAPKTSGRQAAIDYLRENGGGPLPVKDVCAEAAKRSPQMQGKTPTATIAAGIYTAAKRGEVFKIVGRGQVALIESSDAEPVETLAHETGPAVLPGTVVLRDPLGDAEKAATQVEPDPKPSKTTPADKKAANAARMRERRAAAKASK